MNAKLIGFVAMMLVSLFAMTAFASAAIEILEVELDDDVLDPSGTNFVRAVERGESFEVKVTIISPNEDIDNVEIEAEIAGDSRDDFIGDETDVFDMVAGRTYVKKLNLKLTGRMEEDEYLLRVRAQDRNNPTVEETFRFGVELAEHSVRIDDVIFSPSGVVKAGRALLTTVRVENDGDRDEEGVKVTVSIPELGLSAADYIDELEPEGQDDDETTTEELYMRIPDCAAAGLYTVRIDVEFDDHDMRTSEDAIIEIIPGDSCELTATAPGYEDDRAGPQTIITVGSQAQNIEAGANAIYPVTITNNDRQTKTYMVGVDAVDTFGTARVSPSNVLVVGSGETKSAFIYVSAADDAVAGQYGFSVTVSANNEVIQQVPLTANVSGGATVTGLKRALEIGLVVLVVILVILGLIIGFNKLRAEDEEKEQTSAQTYY